MPLFCHKTFDMFIFSELPSIGLSLYCKEGTEMRQLVFRSADVYCQNLNKLNLRNIVIFILEQKEGEKG
jgi:hypothetical protein